MRRKVGQEKGTFERGENKSGRSKRIPGFSTSRIGGGNLKREKTANDKGMNQER